MFGVRVACAAVFLHLHILSYTKTVSFVSVFWLKHENQPVLGEKVAYATVCLHSHGSRDNLLVRPLDSGSKGCEFEPRQERRKNFLLQS